MTSAKALTVPRTLLAVGDEVIEYRFFWRIA